MSEYNLLKIYKSRIPELDGIRGIAVIMVLLFHLVNNQMGQSNIEAFHWKALQSVTGFFWSGVDLFFILSGFLIGSILLKYKESKNYFKTFYIRRFLRIVPVFYILLIIYILMRIINVPDPGNFLYINKLPLLPFFLFIQNYVQAHFDTFGPGPLGPTWSLAVEEQFYLVLPTLIFFLRKKWLPYVVIPLIISAPIFRFFAETWYKSYFPFHMRMDTLLFGVLIAYLVTEKDLIDKAKENYRVLISSILIFITLGVILSVKNIIGVLNHSIFMVIYGLFLIAALSFNKGILGKLLRNGVLRTFGFLSYAIYIFHQLFTGLFHAYIFQDRPRLESFEHVLVTFTSFVVTFIFAYILHFLLERPLINFGHKFKYT
jgi:peptidoglycan/LPS O-acetylase OafA/YrhL